MKRHRLAKDPRVPRELPAFLQPHSAEGGSSSQPQASKSQAFKPAWGFRRTDSVLGSIVHASDRSLHSITPADYQDVVLQSEIEGIDGLGSQALASVSIFTHLLFRFFESSLTCLFTCLRPMLNSKLPFIRLKLGKNKLRATRRLRNPWKKAWRPFESRTWKRTRSWLRLKRSWWKLEAS